MSQSPAKNRTIDEQHPYAVASQHLNRLVRLGYSFSGHERNVCYLNTGGGVFANVSAISGIDFPDDGRAIATCDWDFDGRLDCWVANRSGPQLRFLRNQLESANRFILLRLEGTTSNRDGIGTTVRLTLRGKASPTKRQPLQTIQRTLRAGEGYLAQNSKWLHFGLGQHATITKLEVRWPGGDWQSIEPPSALDLCYTLRQGASRLSRRTLPTTQEHRVTDALEPPESPANTAQLLGRSAPLPPLQYREWESKALVDATQCKGQPTLLNLWASWCLPCVEELKEWKRQEHAIRQAGLRILAVSVDSLDPTSQSSIEAARNIVARVDCSHALGWATPEFVELLQLVNDILVYRDDHRPLPVPTSLLLDGNGNLAGIYKGNVSLERVFQDIQSLKQPAEIRAKQSLPFSGRWLAKPADYRVDHLGQRLWEVGYGAHSLELGKRCTSLISVEMQNQLSWTNALGLRSQKSHKQAQKLLSKILETRPKNSEALMELGIIAGEQGDLDRAIQLLKQSAAATPQPPARVLFNLGTALKRKGILDQAESMFLAATKANPGLAAAHEQLGLLYAASKRYPLAVKSFEMAAELQPKNLQHRFNQLTAMIQQGLLDESLNLLETIVAQHPAHPKVDLYLGEVYEKQGRPDLAIDALRRIVDREPGGAKLWFRIAQLEERITNWQGALQAYRSILKLAPEDPIISSRVAWILSTAPDETLRNGETAVPIAEKAAKSTNHTNPLVLDALAAAYAETGNFARAIEVASLGLKLVVADNNTSFAKKIESRIERYRKHQPYRSAETYVQKSNENSASRGSSVPTFPSPLEE